MAATGIPTPNLGLRIPQGTDPASVDDINYNSNLLDTKIGAVGNDSVQDQIDSLNSELQNSYTVEESTFDGLVFPSSKRARNNMQVVIVSRKIADGSLYVLWYSGAQNGFRVGATLSGNAPVQGDAVVLSYPT